MIVSDEGQAKVFLIYIALGMLCIILADCFFVLRRRFGKTKLRVNVLDGVYYVIAFGLILYAGVRFNFGALRYYQLFALGIGMLLQKLLFSKLTRIAFDAVLVLFLKLAACIIRVLWKITAFVLRGVFFVTDFFEQKTMRVCHKVKRYGDKVKVKRQKKKKTVKKRLRMI